MKIFASFLFFTFFSVSTGDMIQGVLVPDVSYAGGRINITCEYNFEGGTGLYSLKWYHNDTEFYRHVPTDHQRPVNIKPSIRFNVHEVARTEKEVTLQLTSLTSEASGEYKCEVIAEHPSFRTETSADNLTVLDEQPQPPKVETSKSVYDTWETIQVRCEPQPLPPSVPAPSLSWYINGKQVHPSYVKQEPYKALILRIPARQVATENDEAKFECHSKLGDTDIRTSKMVSFKIRSSSLFSFLSKGTSLFIPSSSTTVMLCLLLLLM